MADEHKAKRLEIAHVLFIDIVGYSKLLIDEQSEALQELNQIVRNTEAAREAEAAGQLIFLPTGDGMALVFTGSVEEPVECALQISQRLRVQPSLPVRMGIHSGPVHHVADVNQRENIAGAGINIAQRVMDCGDAGHILVSKRVADDLAQYRRWQPYLHELGDFEVKHGVVVSVVNLYADVVGNPDPPAKFKTVAAAVSAAPGTRSKRGMPWHEIVLALLVIAGLIGAGVFFFSHRTLQQKSAAASSPSPAAAAVSSVPEKSVAVLPFANLREIGQQLGVAHLLEGSVQRAGNKVRVNAQLIDTRTDAHLWAENYDRPLDDVFAIQSEIAKAIANQLQAKIAPNEKAAMENPPTPLCKPRCAFSRMQANPTSLWPITTIMAFAITSVPAASWPSPGAPCLTMPKYSNTPATLIDAKVIGKKLRATWSAPLTSIPVTISPSSTWHCRISRNVAKQINFASRHRP